MRKLYAGNAGVLGGLAIAAPGMWLSRNLADPYFDLGALLVIGLILIGVAFVIVRKDSRPPAEVHTDRNQTTH